MVPQRSTQPGVHNNEYEENSKNDLQFRNAYLVQDCAFDSDKLNMRKTSITLIHISIAITEI